MNERRPASELLGDQSPQSLSSRPRVQTCAKMRPHPTGSESALRRSGFCTAAELGIRRFDEISTARDCVSLGKPLKKTRRKASRNGRSRNSLLLAIPY